MVRVFPILVALAAPAFGLDFTPADHPCWRGAHGSGATPPDAPYTVIADLRSAKKLWTNDEQLPVRGWTNRKQGGVAGGYCGPVVCAGRVFIRYYVPSGEIEDESYKTQYTKDPEAVTAGKFKVAADDVFLCIDARTGKTLWKQVLAGEGINFNHSSQGPLATPFATPERVYFLTTFGYLYCCDAAKGDILWRAPLGKATAWLTKKRRECLEQGTMFSGYSQATVWNACPTLAGGVVVCSDHDYSLKVDDKASCGLVGIDAATGKQRWFLPGYGSYLCSPLRWIDGDDEFVIACNHEKLALIEPGSGRVLWEVTDHEWSSGTPAIGEGHLVLHGRTNDKDATHGWLRCYRFDRQGIEMAWELPAGRPRGKPTWGWGSLCITRGIAIGLFNSDAKPEGAYGGVELATGEVLWQHEPRQNHMQVAWDVVFEGTTPFARFDGGTWTVNKERSDIPLMSYSHPAFADGLVFSRGGDGHVHCHRITR